MYIILLLFLYGFTDVLSQGIIYKKDGSVIEAAKVDKHGKVRSYLLTNQPSESINYISYTLIDSICYADDTVERFTIDYSLEDSSFEKNPKSAIIYYGKNVLGLNILPFFNSKISVFYERLLFTNHIGIRGRYFQNLYSSENDPHSWYFLSEYFFTIGINGYIILFDSLKFRFGFSYLRGTIREYAFWIDGHIDAGLWNCSMLYKVNKNFGIAFGIEDAFIVNSLYSSFDGSSHLMLELSFHF